MLFNNLPLSPFLSTYTLPLLLLLLPLLYYLLPYLRHHTLRTIPGPPIAAFSNLWLLYQCRRGRRYAAVDDVHKRYGSVVRVQPNHVSIAVAEAVGVIYGHSGGWVKSEYYDAFVSIQRGLFNTRDRAEHTRKRKMVAHTFSARSVGLFEVYVRGSLEVLVGQWGRGCEGVGKRGGEGDSWEVDCLGWFNYLAFDIIGDLAFGAPFGMLSKGADIAEVKMTPNSPTTYAPAIQVLNRRGEVSSTLGCLPSLKPYAAYIPDPFFYKGLAAVKNLAGIAVARVNDRLEKEANGTLEEGRKDLLARLMEGKDESGNKLGREELTAEALTQLIAGSDTTSNTSCAWLFWCLKTPDVYATLQRELDEHIPANVQIPTYDTVKDLSFLNATIQETLRIHSTSSLGLPRLVPPGPGVTIAGHHFLPNTALSVPSYTMHHSPEVWNPRKDPVFDPERFNPDRWLGAGLTELQKTCFTPFSTGPRACVGRNVAEMELKLITSTVALGFDIELLEKGGLKTREGFLRKPVGCRVRIRRRERGGR